ncbi:DUF3560 domain-containing protein [Nostocoides sp. F2B08]|uniref:DUF3560 domain-containing protein n=1 Tax=Nostocoides sp. F2B08 TaxID=2653936 RepID=UPI00126380C1|nr:DUF3560 domain-containing protein [Tetrasphaera sp. F2B08]KAB7740966.1 DUF3560 domain-containing protein [Tetrasphaera sp. F2B08]
MTLTIEHTEAEGTLLHGTSRGDGSAEVVKGLGWRWGRSIGLWFVPRSRDAAPKRVLIEQTAVQLRAAGFEVEVVIDTTTGDRGEVEERLAVRAQARAGRLEDRAEREQAKAQQRYAASRRIADGIPFGQPILLGHHSQAGAERDARKIRSHMEASLEHQERAERAAAAAAVAAAGPRHRQSPVTVANRIERLAAGVRRMERSLAQSAAAGHQRQDLEDLLAIDRADLEHWQKVRADQLATGQATNYSPENVAVGDLVKISGSWHTVARCNAKTVAVKTGYSWTSKAPWHTVQEHRPRGAGNA